MGKKLNLKKNVQHRLIQKKGKISEILDQRKQTKPRSVVFIKVKIG